MSSNNAFEKLANDVREKLIERFPNMIITMPDFKTREYRLKVDRRKILFVAHAFDVQCYVNTLDDRTIDVFGLMQFGRDAFILQIVSHVIACLEG